MRQPLTELGTLAQNDPYLYIHEGFSSFRNYTIFHSGGVGAGIGAAVIFLLPNPEVNGSIPAWSIVKYLDDH